MNTNTHLILKNRRRQYQRREGLSLSELWPLYLREARKRNFSWSLLLQALLNLLNPAEIVRTSVAWLWYLGVTVVLKSPILLWRELRAASLLHEHHNYPDSLVSIMSCYLPLIFRVSDSHGFFIISLRTAEGSDLRIYFRLHLRRQASSCSRFWRF